MPQFNDNLFLIMIVVLGTVAVFLTIAVTWIVISKARKKSKAKKEEQQKLILDELEKQQTKKAEKFVKVDEAATSDHFKRIPSPITRWLKLRKAKKNPDITTLIRMELNNGRHREFTVQEDPDKKGFIYRKGRYIFDPEAKYYLIDSNIWAYDYHEGITIPIRRRIPVNEIREGIDAKAAIQIQDIQIEVENAVNPLLLQRFLLAEVAQGIMRGASLGALFKLLVVLVIIGMLLAGVDLAISVYSSGLLEQIKL
ncbi:MAG: hypothetical protein GTO02_13575 [Candidatus Dadabacteria bacterium]|nr:hypothetical protein [Candidatus Dadabacteria bacterium]